MLADVTGDLQEELIVIGEWMAPVIYRSTGEILERLPSNLNTLSGWWSAIAVADLDGDGRTDLVLGNLGENFYLKGDQDSPLKLWLADFENNGSMENIVSRVIDRRDMPVPLKKELMSQLPGLKKRNILHADYARKSMQELFDSEVLARARVKEAGYFSSIIAWNDGHGNFTVERLPDLVQFSSVFAILCTDINHNGLPDIILGGNDMGLTPQFSRLDASRGHVLINLGNRQLKHLSSMDSGLNVGGAIRSLSTLHSDFGPVIIVGVNDEMPRALKTHEHE